MSHFAFLSFLFFLLPKMVFASSGFTFLGPVAHQLHIPEQVLTFTLVAVFILILGVIYKMVMAGKKESDLPDKGITFRNVIELFGQFIYDQTKSIIGEKEGPKYFSFVGGIFLLIFLSNLIGLIPGFIPPTENLNTTLALGLISFAYYNLHGCKTQGTINYLKHFLGPLWYMAILIGPIEIISNSVRPISLAFRLRGNMFGDHLVIEIFGQLAPYIVPVIFMILGLLVSFIQAYVFTVLSMVYIGLATEHHDHDEEGHAAH